jgi:hypothetical protein
LPPRCAIPELLGDLGDVVLSYASFTVEFLFPVRTTFEERTEELAYAWTLLYFMGDTGEIGV